jgi:hypothetical protein
MGASTKDLLALTEGILADTPPVKEVVVHSDPLVDDGIKAVKVPDSYVDQVLGFSKALNESEDPDKKSKALSKVKQLDESELLKERLESLVERLKSLLKEAKVVMEELTASGSIGCAPGRKKRKKNELIRRN